VCIYVIDREISGSGSVARSASSAWVGLAFRGSEPIRIIRSYRFGDGGLL
jgi:hypothetical protein